MSEVKQMKIPSKAEGFSLLEKLMLAGLMMQSVMTLMDVTMFNVAIPSIQEEFRLPIETIALVVSIRYLARLGLMPIYGVVGDRLGKKRIYMAGLVIFIIGSFVGWFSPTLIWLVIGRFLQGMGGASMPLSMALITDAFSRERRGRALGAWNAAAPAGAMLGPVLGGYLIEGYGWRSVFAIIAIGSIIALLFIYKLVPKSPPNRASQTQFDWTGAIALMILATFFLLAATTSSIIPFGSPLNITFWMIAAFGLGLLIRNAIRNPNPLIGSTEVKNPRLTLPSISVSARMIATTGATFLLVIYLTNVFDMSASSVGTFILFYSLASLIGVPLGGMLADRWVSRKSGAFGLFFLAAGMIWLGFISPQTNPYVLVPGMLLGGLGAGLCLVSFTKEAVPSLGEEKVGLASGLYNMVRFTGASLSAPLLGLLLAAGYQQCTGCKHTPQPYQLGFQVLAIIAIMGIFFAALIPLPSSTEKIETQAKSNT